VAATTSVLIPITWVGTSRTRLSYKLTMIQGGIMYSWSAWRTLIPLALGVFGLLGFVSYSVYLSKEPLIRRSLFNSPTAIVAYFIHGLIVWSLLYYMPLYFQVAKNYTPISSGIAIFPLTFTTAPAAVVVGIVITKTGRYRPSVVCPSPSPTSSSRN
jgi:hypothetical protein